jgi:hypothetical protein
MAAGMDWAGNPLSYELEVLTLVNNEGEGFDIREMMLECNIYENILNNFLIGEIAIADAVGFLENAKIFGQESLHIKFKQPFGKGDKPSDEDTIDQIFRIHKVSGIKRMGQNTTVYKLSFSSPEMVHAKRIRVSQALRGSMTDIAGKLAKDHLGISIDESSGDPKLTPYFQVREKSQGDNYHVIMPNWTVNYAINWCCGQAQGIDSQSGLQDSYFFFQTANGGYRIQSVASMMDVEYLTGTPFTFAPAATNKTDLAWDETKEGIGAGRRILDYTIGSGANILEGTMEGLFASKQITIDNTYKYQTEKTYSYLERFYSGKSMAMNDYPMVRKQPETIYIGEPAGEDEDVTVSSHIEYGHISSYPDALISLESDSHFVNDEGNKINQANHNTHLGQAQFRTAVKQLLKYYTMNVLLPTRTDISVGQLINLDIPPTRGLTAETNPALFHSGKHLITEIKWSLTQNECRTNIKVIKDSVINRIETTDPEFAPLEGQGDTV